MNDEASNKCIEVLSSIDYSLERIADVLEDIYNLMEMADDDVVYDKDAESN